MAIRTITTNASREVAEELLRRVLIRITLIALMLIVLVLAGCSSLPANVQRAASAAISDETTALARTAAKSLPDAGAEMSGLRLIADAGEALAARIELIRRAERSLDVQYYQIASDATGLAFLRELREAARRGVRVRLLVDDLYAAGQDELFAALAATAGFELRLFNPLPVRAAGFAVRVALSLHEFDRINRRMHNKLFIADGVFAIAGGRNIADEYFMRAKAANFVDMDVLAAGPVVRELATVFDRYWNHEAAYPVQSLAAAAAASRFDALSAGADLGPRASQIAHELRSGRVNLVAAKAQVLACDPAKAAGAARHTTRQGVAAALALAEREISIVSPYFVPGEGGMAMLQAAAARGVALTVTTNSLGATDEPLVHAGYSRYRLAMLKMGVKLQELGSTLSRKLGLLGDFRSSNGRLHAKLAVIDGQRLFIGSMNMDGRSERHNTEVGLLIESPQLAAEVAELFHASAQAATYRLRLAADGRIEWLAREEGGEVAYTEEPDSNAGLRLKLAVLGAFIDEDLL